MKMIGSQLDGIRSEAKLEQESHGDGFASPMPRPQRFRFKSGDENHIVCREWDGTTEGDTDVLIALDPDVRKSEVGGGYTYANFQQRTRDSDSRAEEIYPAFASDDDVWAIQVDGGTGVTVSGTELTWMIWKPVIKWMHIC